MSPLLQSLVIAVVIAAAVAYLGWSFFRTFVGKKDCGCGGGKCAKMEGTLKKIGAAGKK